MAQQTATEWLCMQLLDLDNHKIWPSLLERAKNMEKQQMQQPIIRPTDEEITAKSLQYSQWYDQYKPFYNGAKWMLEHIIKLNR